MPDGTQDKRRWWILQNIIGKPKADGLDKDLAQAETMLDGAGVARKAEGEEEEKPPAEAPPPEQEQPMPEPEPDDMMAKLSAKIAESLMVALGEKLEGRVSEQDMTAAVLSALEAPPDDPEAEGEVTPPEEEQIMESKTVKKAADSMTCPMCGETAMKQEGGEFHCANCGWTGSKALHTEEAKAYAESFASMVKDMRDTAAYVQTMAEGQKQTADVQKSILDAVGALVKQVQALEEKVNGRPRSASQASETLIDPTSEAGKALEAAIKKGTNNTRVWGGIPLADK